MKQRLLFLALSITQFLPLSAMEITGIEKPITVAFLKNSVAIGGENGCAIVDAVSGKLMYNLTEEKTYQIAATRDKKTLAIIDTKGLRCFNAETGEKELFIKHERAAIAFNVNNRLLAYTASSGELRTYNHIAKTFTYQRDLELKPGTTPFTTIACHPTKNEFIYPSKENRLSIAQFGCKPLIKAHLEPSNIYYCIAGEYSPDGRYIAINGHVKKCFIYDIEQNTCLQLCADNQEYLAMTFHPHNSIIALLTHSSIVHYFNYKTGRLIAATHPLNVPCHSEYILLHNRLAFSDIGTQLVVAPPGQGSFILDLPPYQLLLIYYALYYYGYLPTELRWFILSIAMQHNTVAPPCFSYLDCAEFMFIAPIMHPAEISEEQEFPMELETDMRKFEAIYIQ